MIPHFPGKIRAPPPTTDSGRHTGALRAPWGASLDGQFPLDKTHTRARARTCVGASVRGRRRLRRLWADGRRASGAWAPLLGGALWAPWGAEASRVLVGALKGRSSSALLRAGRSLGAPRALLGRARSACWGAPRALLRRARGALVGALLGRSSGAFRRARGALVGALVERSSGARGALVLGAPRALLRRSLGASGYHLGTTWAFYASPVLSWWHKVITQKHGHS